MPNSVIVISSINQDTTLSVSEFPRPGETVHSKQTTRSLGGKGANVAIAAAHATKSVYMVGAIGSDGSDEETTLKSHGVNTSFLQRCDTGIGRAVILVNDSGENCIIVSKGANAFVTSDMPEELQREIKGSIVVLQLEIEHEVTQELGVLADEMGATVVFNPSPAPRECSVILRDEAKIWKACGMIILNEVEVEQICRIGGKKDAENVLETWSVCIEEVCKRCRDDVTILITIGKDGVVYYRNGRMKHVPGVVVDDVVDTTGAGDTFTGFLVGGLAEGKEFEECIQVAVAAGAACVKRHGAGDSIPTIEDVKQVVQNQKEKKRHCKELVTRASITDR